ncbi:uncharacterized protein CFAP97D2 [Tachysurus fulvidraco]|uniref:uncharacterized protein CFAP97D2 n=1 Tax=Tachysurus fulvidraco TaxID=1234273 RepID=UPI000F4EFFD0|nr:uncharacterized protein CFAP97D2 [Tachysurus fulvidraco]
MQHKSHQPLQPCASKYLQFRWDKSGYEIHNKKVQSAKAKVNTTPPKIYNHILLKRKKKMMEEERLSTIQRDNRMLLDKISHIKQTSGQIDCRNEYVNKRLDTDKRQEALLEIVKDNKIILRRLAQCTPYYSVQVWNEQWIKTLDVMKSIGRFPPLSHAQRPVDVLPQKTMRFSKEEANEEHMI